MTSLQLVDAIEKVYHDILTVDNDTKFSFRLVNMMKTWLEISYFSIDNVVRQRLSQFFETIANDNRDLGKFS